MSGVEVYVLDSGVDAIGDLNVVDAVNFTKSKTTDDRARHGLPVASILGAKDDAAGLVGVAPGVRIHNYKVLDDNGKTDLSVVINALERVMEHRSADPATPVVVSMSFGADIQSTEYNALDQAVREAVAAGIVVVVAAGNEGVDASTVSPAHAAEAITVGAFDRLSLYASFSNFGPAVDLLAPGVSVEALTSATEYNFLTGTSAAAPHVAGAAALYLSTHPAATPGEVRDALVNAALPLVIGAPDGTTNRALNVASF